MAWSALEMVKIDLQIKWNETSSTQSWVENTLDYTLLLLSQLSLGIGWVAAVPTNRVLLTYMYYGHLT